MTEQKPDNQRSQNGVVTEQAIKAILSDYVGAPAAQASDTPQTEQADETMRAVQETVRASSKKRFTPGRFSKRRGPTLPDLPPLPKLTRKRAIWLGVAALVLLRPMWIVLAVILLVFAVSGLFLGLGADRVWEGVARGLNRYERRKPARAIALRERLDRIAVKWDSVLDKLPEGLVDGLYLPDFSEQARRTVDSDAVFEQRLTRLGEQC